MARFTEAVYLKAGDKHMPAVSGTKLRECSRDLVDKNQALVRATNAYLDQPENPETGDKVMKMVPLCLFLCFFETFLSCARLFVLRTELLTRRFRQ
jgi:hypothetical protein